MKELILLGRGPTSSECPYDAEVWCASTALLMPEARFDCISKAFAFDGLDLEEVKRSVEIAKEHSIPVVSIESYATEPYPLNEIQAEFHSNVYLKTTASYMLAMAILQGYEKLRLFGIDQGPEWKYISTKYYVTFWLGVAVGRNIEYELSGRCLLLEPFMEEVKQHFEGKAWELVRGIIAKQL